MDILLIIYNIGLFILFTVVATLGIITYLQKKRPFFLTITFLFVFLIINNILIYLTEQIPWFSDGFDQIFMTTPSPKTILLVAHSVFLVLILDAALQAKIQTWQYLLVIAQTTVLLFVPMLPNNAFKVWIFYFTSEIVRIVLATYGLYVLKNMNQEEYEKNASHIDIQISNSDLFRKLLIITIIMTVVIIIEDTIVIFFHDSYALDQVHMTNRSISEDLLAIIYASIAIGYLTKDLIQPVFAGNVLDDACPAESLSITKQRKFAHTYSMTSREIEVLMLLLENKSNLEISSELFISMGTVKSHIHNIFMKLDVTRRREVQNLYSEYRVDL
ncbi:helix-turn-helix transcriptional regulator [Bacilli bacterium]|nr:helix-turn-helix transcriptional regulator [Bacilli bacterium]GHU42006.1 helix-turn-helix transcriptional regulator [Bacilli bacterium]